MKTIFQRIGLGTKLSLFAGLSFACLFLTFTLVLSHQASQQLESLAREDLKSQTSGVVDMVQMFDATLTEEVSNYTTLLNSFIPQPITRDAAQMQALNNQSVPLLKGGELSLHENNGLTDDFQTRTGAIATLFVRSGDDYVRVATSLRKEDGTRAVGTQLDRASPAWLPMSKGEIYRGLTRLFGKRYITQYQPVKDEQGNVIAVLFVGVDISSSWQLMREKILSRKLGDSGHFYVINRQPGEPFGQYLFHRDAEGQKPLLPEDIRQRLLADSEGELAWQRDTGGTSLMTFTHVPGWNWVVVGEVDRGTLLANIDRLRNQFLLAGLVISLLFAILFDFTTRRLLTAPLRNVIGLAQQYGAGDLRSSITTRRQDEVGELIAAINSMGNGLQQIVIQVRDAAADISHGTDELAADSHDISEQINKQASSVEETSASMEQLTATVEQNAENMVQTQNYMQQASHAVHIGGDTVTNAVSTMNAIRDASRRIADITHVIESIAFQTNILALNAAVEAARAGEHGKGFAVVAQEVRALAARSANAVKEIDALIEDTLHKVTEGHQLSERTRQAMEQIIQHIDQVNLLVTHSSQASHEQSAGIQQVNLAMNHIGEATHINAERVSRSEQTAHTLRDKGHHLNTLVSVFRLRNS
ncbi:methyl-accepting chemotaxis protein [Atlantibacter subterraneus]|uniref:methyl-accepting chemotaxis protein n=1 Tax=Atlantibacter subterraneus TaxID=255519 RepID=UPI002963FC61|nr:Cache 3/Cache 2 fusion domain-containing protein [Atlantibacter subterranea]MDW2742521.1 Cache 3/Cache 2 fusion domain-containing protein [Atlantibacter subterranea]